MAFLLKLSRGAVRHRTQRGLLLAAPLASGALVYPLFQLDGERVLPGFSAAAEPFRAHHVEAWATLDWFTTPSKVLRGRTPAMVIRDQTTELGAVLALACDTAARWSRLDPMATPSHPAGSHVGDGPKAHRSQHRGATANDPHLHLGTERTSMADESIPQLTPLERARWTAMQSAVDAAAHALTSPTADGDELQAAVNQIQAIDLDMGRVRDSLHIPNDAGDNAAALEAVLRRIPPGWGRWISCKAGWYPLVVRTDRELAEIDPDYTVHQIKEKWSVLEYYAHTRRGAAVEAAMRAVTDRARDESEHTCELCGRPGGEFTKFDYIKTLCVDCAARTGFCAAPRPTTER